MTGQHTESTLWVSAALCLHLLRWAQSDGLDPERLLSESGLSAMPTPGSHSRVSVKVQYRLWEAIRLERAAGVGWRSGREMALGNLPTLGPLLGSSRSVGHCFASLADFLPLASNAVVGSWGQRLDGSGVLELRHLHTQHHAEATRSALANWLSGIGRAAGRALPVQEVDFPFADDGVPFPLELGAPRVSFNAPRFRLLLDASVLETPMLGADERVNAGMRRIGLEALSARDSARLRCLRALASLPPRAGQPAVSRCLGVSVRALQRSLWEEGVAFRSLQGQDLVRRATELLLIRPDVPIEEIADRLRFSRRAFERAFKRWTGQSPGQWRKQRS